MLSLRFVVRLCWFVISHLDGTPFHGRYPGAAVPLSGVILDVKCETSANIWTVTCVMSPVPTSLCIGLLLTILCSRFSSWSREAITCLIQQTDLSKYSKDCTAQIIELMDEILKFITFASKHARVQIQLSEAEFYPHNSLFTAVYCISSNAWQCFLFTIILS